MAEARELKNVVFAEPPYAEMARRYSIVYASVATLRRMKGAESMRLSKIFPSLSCGVPVIYAGDSEAAQLLFDEECGVRVAPEDPSALAEVIQRLADNPDQRKKMGEAGRQLIDREYSWSEIVRRWVAELEIPPAESSREAA